jgi:hypothetical protein
MDDNPYRSPESPSAPQLERMQLRGLGLIGFFVGGWLSVLVGMIAAMIVISVIARTLSQIGGRALVNSTGGMLLGGLLALTVTLLGGWGAGRLYRLAFSAIFSRSRNE